MKKEGQRQGWVAGKRVLTGQNGKAGSGMVRRTECKTTDTEMRPNIDLPEAELLMATFSPICKFHIYSRHDG